MERGAVFPGWLALAKHIHPKEWDGGAGKTDCSAAFGKGDRRAARPYFSFHPRVVCQSRRFFLSAGRFIRLREEVSPFRRDSLPGMGGPPLEREVRPLEQPIFRKEGGPWTEK